MVLKIEIYLLWNMHHWIILWLKWEILTLKRLRSVDIWCLMNRLYSTCLSALKCEHQGSPLVIRVLGSERLGKISTKAMRNAETPVPERWHFLHPLLKAVWKLSCVTCCVASRHPFWWPKSFPNTLGLVLPTLHSNFDSNCQVEASQDRRYI